MLIIIDVHNVCSNRNSHLHVHVYNIYIAGIPEVIRESTGMLLFEITVAHGTLDLSVSPLSSATGFAGQKG